MQTQPTNHSAPHEAGAVYLVKKADSIELTTKPPMFIAAHSYKCCSFDMGTLKIGKERTEKVGDRIKVCGHHFEVNAIDDAKPWKGGMEALRMSDEDAKAWHAMKSRHDAEKQRMVEESHAFRRDALNRARRVCKSDCLATETAHAAV